MTGITGQIGASLARLLAPDNDVIGVARFTRPGSRADVEAMGVHAVTCDYTTGRLDNVPTDVDHVIHVAADVDPVSIDVGVHQNAEGTGLLFNHLRTARSWFYTSASGVYWDHPDPWYEYLETDRCGGSNRLTQRFHYGTSKFAGEAVARTMSRIHEVPLVIARLSWGYGGTTGQGGMPGKILEQVVTGTPIAVHPDWAFVGNPIHEDDLAGCIGPFLAAATVGGTIVNWGGDDAITNVQMAEYIGELVGRAPMFEEDTRARAYPRALDSTRRREIYGPCRVGWKEGVRDLVRLRHPELLVRDVGA